MCPALVRSHATEVRRDAPAGDVRLISKDGQAGRSVQVSPRAQRGRRVINRPPIPSPSPTHLCSVLQPDEPATMATDYKSSEKALADNEKDAIVSVQHNSGPAVHLEHVDGLTSEGEWKQLLEDAIHAEANERAMGWRLAFKRYPKAVFWSFAISLCIVMSALLLILLTGCSLL